MCVYVFYVDILYICIICPYMLHAVLFLFGHVHDVHMCSTCVGNVTHAPCAHCQLCALCAACSSSPQFLSMQLDVCTACCMQLLSMQLLSVVANCVHCQLCALPTAHIANCVHCVLHTVPLYGPPVPLPSVDPEYVRLGELRRNWDYVSVYDA